MRTLNGCSSTQFAVFRIALGLFLVTHFLSLLPYASELYGATGMFPAEIQSPFPNLLATLPSSSAINAYFVLSTILAICLAFGFLRRPAAILLWYSWACLTNRVPILYIPSEGLVGWMLLLTAAIPTGESSAIYPRPKREWTLPLPFLFVAWLVMAVGYLASGLDKLASPSWQYGSAIGAVLASPISRWDFPSQVFDSLPTLIGHLISWSVLAIEIFFFALIWHPITRSIAWILMTAMHLAIRLLLDLHTITDAFLVAHLLLFDSAWFRWRCCASSPR